MTEGKDPLRFETPLYTVAEAARFLGVPASTLRTWAHGYQRRPRGRRPVTGGPILTTVNAQRRHPNIPFVGLVEGTVAAAFRRAGVSMQHMRRALEVLEAEIGVEHALASRKLYTDGAQILYDYATTEDDEELTVVVGGQRVFHDVIRDYLQLISYADDGWAERLVLPITQRRVVECDPARGFGRPLFIVGGAPMDDVLDRLRAGEPLQDVAKDFDLRAEDVEDVIRAALPHAA
ncbi:DUF433 domain-containing protein [Rhabdothermincola sediminis]|uniref:DUF433 domain-containing protein n=1 Tax=Rhabdothermincola sediminis TaxID=2751370 RepID=UPI001AA03B4E|nr:DUF433 domain-containing protein [Rhabdothermincola sediminis]